MSSFQEWFDGVSAYIVLTIAGVLLIFIILFIIFAIVFIRKTLKQKRIVSNRPEVYEKENSVYSKQQSSNVRNENNKNDSDVETIPEPKNNKRTSNLKERNQKYENTDSDETSRNSTALKSIAQPVNYVNNFKPKTNDNKKPVVQPIQKPKPIVFSDSESENEELPTPIKKNVPIKPKTDNRRKIISPPPSIYTVDESIVEDSPRRFLPTKYKTQNNKKSDLQKIAKEFRRPSPEDLNATRV